MTAAYLILRSATMYPHVHLLLQHAVPALYRFLKTTVAAFEHVHKNVTNTMSVGFLRVDLHVYCILY